MATTWCNLAWHDDLTFLNSNFSPQNYELKIDFVCWKLAFIQSTWDQAIKKLRSQKRKNIYNTFLYAIENFPFGIKRWSSFVCVCLFIYLIYMYVCIFIFILYLGLWIEWVDMDSTLQVCLYSMPLKNYYCMKSFAHHFFFSLCNEFCISFFCLVKKVGSFNSGWKKSLWIWLLLLLCWPCLPMQGYCV